MIVGIDLGTTHSLVGKYAPDGPVLFPNALGRLLTPSVVSVDEADHLIVGEAARDRLTSHPTRTVAAFKRWMGTDRSVTLGKRQFRAEELSALVLRSLVEDAEAATGQKVTEAVISVPAYFSDAQRKATRTAGELAGIRVERLVNEPTAAALAYGLHRRDDNSRFLVFDLGGGTFDVSILEMFSGVMQVHASAGDNFLGGEDFTEALVEACLASLGLTPCALEPRQRALLEYRVEQAKRSLASAGQTDIRVESVRGQASWTLDETSFQAACEPLLQRLRAPVERAMRDAGLVPSDLDEILLVGGASRMPEVAKLASRMFGRLPLRHVNPDEAIALGACVAAGLKARDQALEEIILTDVCPYTLGVRVSRQIAPNRFDDGVFHPLIERNSTVPVSRVDDFYPNQDEQTEIHLQVFQGESPRVDHNVFLGEIRMPLARRSREENRIEVRFTYDINGLLQVEALLVADNRRQELVIESNPGVLSPTEIRERLAALAAIKVHPRDQQENIAALARAERLYEEYLGDFRNVIQDWIAQFHSALATQDARVVEESRRRFHEAMDSLDRPVDA